MEVLDLLNTANPIKGTILCSIYSKTNEFSETSELGEPGEIHLI